VKRKNEMKNINEEKRKRVEEPSFIPVFLLQSASRNPEETPTLKTLL
jgi:hypothetical protein